MTRHVRRALITGIAGQDGSYLAELLLSKGYEVHGIIRRTSGITTTRIDHLYVDPQEQEQPRLRLHHGDLLDGASLRRVLKNVRPHEVYNLGAQSHVHVSFDEAELTANVIALGSLRLLEAVRDRIVESGEEIRFYQASSSEMFGRSPAPQNEDTPFRPRSPYGVSKLAAHWHAVGHREAYGMFVCSGILFNHESPRRGETFVSRKITRAAGRIKAGLQQKLYLGNLDARRDWGFAGDYVDAMWRMMQLESPEDFVVATGLSHSVKDFVEMAFGVADLDWHRHVEIDPHYLRPSEVNDLRGDPSKCNRQLGWSPTVDFEQLVQLMVEHDTHLAEQERSLEISGPRNTLPRDIAKG